jgi:hypothetical protein
VPFLGPGLRGIPLFFGYEETDMILTARMTAHRNIAEALNSGGVCYPNAVAAEIIDSILAAVREDLGDSSDTPSAAVWPSRDAHLIATIERGTPWANQHALIRLSYDHLTVIYEARVRELEAEINKLEMERDDIYLGRPTRDTDLA